MKVKIGNKIFDSEKEPIMLILSNDDKYNISHMDKSCTKYCSYPGDGKFDSKQIEEFMKI